MRRSHSSSQSAAAPARPKSQPPLKLGESIKFSSAKVIKSGNSPSSSSSTRQQQQQQQSLVEEEQHWSKLIEKYDKSRGRFAASSRPMLATLVEHSSSSSSGRDATKFAGSEHTRPEDEDSDEDEPELSPLTSSASSSSSSSGSSLTSSTLSLSSVSSASTVIGAKRIMAATNEADVKAKVSSISDEDDHQSSESSSSSSGVSSLSERKASLSLSTSSSTASSGGESLGQLERAVGECLEDLVDSVAQEGEEEDKREQEECTLQALMVKRIPLHEHNKIEPEQIIGLARRHIFNALRHAQEVGERESGWWVCVGGGGGDKYAVDNLHAQSQPAPIISWHQDKEQPGQEFQVFAREIIDCLIEHELVIWLLKSNQQVGSNHYKEHDNWRALNDVELNQRSTSGNLIGVHSDEVDWDSDQADKQQQRASQMEAVIWLCSSELDARQVKECWQHRLSSCSSSSADASVSRSSSPPIVCQTPVECERPTGNEIKLNGAGESESGGIVIAAAADQRTRHRRDNNERQMMSAATERSSNLRRAASVFDLSTATATSGGRPDTGSHRDETASGLASHYRNARSNANKLIRNLKDEMVKLNSAGGGRRVSSVLVVQRQSECAPTTLRATNSVCDLSGEQSLPPPLVGDGKSVRKATGVECAPPTSQAGNVTPAAAPPVVKPRTSILKARRDSAAAANADAQANRLAARQQVAPVTGSKCDLPQQQQQQQQNINRMVSSTSLNCLHQLHGGGGGAGEKPPRSILKAIQVEKKEPGNQLNGLSKRSSSGGKSGGGAQVVVVSARAASSAATAPPPSPLKIRQEHPRRADSNEITRATTIGGDGDEQGKRDKKTELLVTPRSSRGGAEVAGPQPGARSQILALGSTSSSSSAVSKRKLVHSLANCEIVARTHQQTQQQRARELSVSTSDIRDCAGGTTKSKEIGVERSCTAARRDGVGGSAGTSKREEPANTRSYGGGGEDEFVSSGSLAREQAFERLRMRASCYDITRLMSKNNTIQSQLARLRAGGSGDLRQRKPAELRASSDQLAGKELKAKRDGVCATANQKQTTPKTPDDPKRDKRMSMFEQSSATSASARDTSSRSATLKRAESVKCKKPPVGGVAVLRHQQELGEDEAVSESLEARGEDKERVVAKIAVDARQQDDDDDDDESDIEEEAQPGDDVDQGEDSEATIVEEEAEEVEATKTSKTSALGKATAGGLSKFNLLRQSFNQKTISSMLKFSSRASLRIGAGKRAPVPGPEVPTAAAASGESTKVDMKANAVVVAAEPKPREAYQQAPTKLPKASKSPRQLVDLQQQQQIAAIDSATMMLYNRHMQQRQQQQQQQQQLLHQQQQQYAYQWHQQQQQIYIQQHHQRQQLAYMANQYMTTAAHQHHLYQPHLLVPGAPIAPQAAMGGFAAASSATTSMYAMTAAQQQPHMMPHPHRPPTSSVGSILKKSILKPSSSNKHNNNVVANQMSYSGRALPTTSHHQPSQQLIPLSVNHHSSVNIVYGAPRLDNSTSGQQQFANQEELPVTKIKQPSRANLLGASMRKTVKSILVSSKSSPTSSQQQQQEAAGETEKPPARPPLKSALKKPKSRVSVPDSIQLNSEGSDGDQSTSSTLESTSSNSSFDRDGDHQPPKSVLKKKSSPSGGATGATVLDEPPELSSTDELSSSSSSTSSSDNNFKRATSTRCSRRITKSPPKQFESACAVPSRASTRAPRKNVTFSTKLTSIL